MTCVGVSHCGESAGSLQVSACKGQSLVRSDQINCTPNLFLTTGEWPVINFKLISLLHCLLGSHELFFKPGPSRDCFSDKTTFVWWWDHQPWINTNMFQMCSSEWMFKLGAVSKLHISTPFMVFQHKYVSWVSLGTLQGSAPPLQKWHLKAAWLSPQLNPEAGLKTADTGSTKCLDVQNLQYAVCETDQSVSPTVSHNAMCSSGRNN